MQSNENESNNEERLRLVMTNIEARLRKLMREDPGTLDQIEASVDEVGDFIKEEITKEIVSNLGAGYQGSRIDCAVCRSRAKYCGTRSREVITLHGRLKFNRAYYYCKVCRSSLCPTDKQLGLGRDDCSRTVKAYSARVASYLPFAVAAKELKALRRIDISATKVQENAK